MLRWSAIAMALLVAGCASANLPEAYRSKGSSGAVNCAAYPAPPAPASCRNLYENIIHPA